MLYHKHFIGSALVLADFAQPEKNHIFNSR